MARQPFAFWKRTKARTLKAHSVSWNHKTSACTAGLDDPGLRAFPECKGLSGYLGGACGNCKWRDHAARCSVRDQEAGDGQASQPEPSEPVPSPGNELVLYDPHIQQKSVVESQIESA